MAQVYGDFELIDETNGDVFAFQRKLDFRSVIIILNFTTKNIDFTIPSGITGGIDNSDKYNLLISNYQVKDTESQILIGGTVRLNGYEGRIYDSQSV